MELVEVASEPSASARRSQSSVQLLGFIENCVEVSTGETSADEELRVQGYRALLDASTAVLSCIQVGDLKLI